MQKSKQYTPNWFNFILAIIGVIILLWLSSGNEGIQPYKKQYLKPYKTTKNDKNNYQW